MISANFLRLVSHRAAPHPRILELRNKLFVKTVAKVLNRRAGVVQDDGGAIIRDLSFGLLRKK